MIYDSFHPGQVWLDTDGNRIQAHGGSILVVDGVYYWYGENKEKTDGKSKIWHWGIRCYSSTDLYNWKSEGIIIPPNTENLNSSLTPEACVDRPHILYNKKNKKFVCWVKVMTGEDVDAVQSMTVLTADSILGPYTVVEEGIRPFGMKAGDFDLVIAPEDDKAYIYFERCHTEIICADLTEDYTNISGYYTTHFPKSGPPFTREAPAHFYRKGKHYLITSGTTGYMPNPSEAAVADTFHGPYTVLGNPHKDDSSNTSFHSQVTSVFKVPGKKDLYIALADRWLPEAMDLEYSVYGDLFDFYFHPDEHPYIDDSFFEWPLQNTCIADYVWLPILFEGGKPVILWRDSWKLDEFE